MRILYAIQGTGNGHVSRALEIIPHLQELGEVDILLSGTQSDIKLPFPVKYTYKGLSFIFGKNGGIDFLQTFQQLSSKEFLKNMQHLPVEHYNLVLTDFEPLSAWSCYYKKVPCIALSHQCAVLHKSAPKPKKKDPIGKAVLKYYAPVTHKYGFHFASFDKHIFTPVIRKQVREMKPREGNHYTIYLPSFSDDKILNMALYFEDIQWQVFSKHTHKPYEVKNVRIVPIQNEAFVESMRTCKGVLCGAGFETPAEALFLKKKLAVIPMKMQYEQQCNAEALKKMGVPVFKNLKQKRFNAIADWLAAEEKVVVEYADSTAAILQHIVSKHATEKVANPSSAISFAHASV